MPTLPTSKRLAKLNDYDGFVEKFKPKKTTDDCYTPQPVYDAILRWISENIMPLEGMEVVRPFWPGGDFENFDYPSGCIVIDNPPFSMMARIVRFYRSLGIPYFLFAPALTMANSAKEVGDTFIVTRAVITYENGAKVATSFRTSLDCGGTEIWASGSLTKAIEEADKAWRAENRKTIPKYRYPDCVASPAILRKIAEPGIEFRVSRSDCRKISGIKSNPKGLYGGGWLLSERAAAERAAAERAAAERAAAERAAAERAAAKECHIFQLSAEEQAVVDSLGKE